MATETTRRSRGRPPGVSIEQHPLWLSVLLHLFPGAVIVAVYVLLAQPVIDRGYPGLVALLLAALLVVVPVELGILVYLGYRRNGVLSLSGVVEYRRSLSRWKYAAYGAGLVVWSFLVFGVASAVEPVILDALFGWLPTWFVKPLAPDAAGDLSTTVLYATSGLLVNGFVAPIVEELYFRGYLLPRLDRYGPWAPIANAVLFSVYHFWSPWQAVTRILALLPMVYLVWRTRNVYLGIVVHVLLNVIGMVLTIGLVLSMV